MSINLFFIVAIIFIYSNSTLAAEHRSRPVNDENINNIDTLATMKGKCREFIVGGKDWTTLCEPKVVNAAYRNGKASFTFIASDKAMVGFFGKDSRAQGDKATLKVEKITLNLLMGMPSTMADATGICIYTNPYNGPSVIKCSARSSGKNFSATFVSDGREPTIQEF